jgi:hypothetical protein
MRRAAAVLLVLALSACTDGPSARTPVTDPDFASTLPLRPPPTPALGEDAGLAGARAVAEEQVRRYTGRDYAGAWDLWSARGRRALSRYDYVRLSNACAGLVELSVESVRADGARRAVARLRRVGGTVDYPLVREAGRWRWQPAADDLRSYRAGVEALVASC